MGWWSVADARTAHSRAGNVQQDEQLSLQGQSLQIRLAGRTDELRAIEELLAAIWAAPNGRPPVGADVLTAFVQTGNYVACAWVDGALVGASVAFFRL
jgi:predicted GNAT superfamily acetyltransferase